MKSATQFSWQQCFTNPIFRAICVGFFFVLSFNSAFAETLTLQEAINLATNASPQLAVATREREAIEGARTQAAVRPNPSISTSIQDTRSENRQTFLQLNQEIELGNKRQVRMDAADALYSKANLELELKKAEVHANTVAAFYEVLVAQEKLKLSCALRFCKKGPGW
jgi:outer membrane protein, heavy metal efflux system